METQLQSLDPLSPEPLGSPEAPDDFPLYLNADGSPKMMYQAKSAAERAAISAHTTYVNSSRTVGKRAVETLTTNVL